MKDKTVIHIQPTLDKLSQQLADRFVELADFYIQRQGSFHAALSGGNTPQPFFRLLASELYRNQLNWSKIHLYQCDERFVPLAHPDSNAGALKRCLADHVPLAENHLHLIQTEVITPEASALNYATTLQKHLPINDTNHPQFDFILLGTAIDGHVASLFPNTTVLSIQHQLTAAVFVEKLQSQRITLTFSMINHARHMAFIVTGKNKAPVVQRVFAGTTPYYPIQMLRPEGKVEWYLDQSPVAPAEP